MEENANQHNSKYGHFLSSDSEQYYLAWKLRPLFDHLLKHFQEAMWPESHQLIDEHMCKFNGKSLMHQYMKNKPIK